MGQFLWMLFIIVPLLFVVLLLFIPFIPHLLYIASCIWVIFFIIDFCATGLKLIKQEIQEDFLKKEANLQERKMKVQMQKENPSETDVSDESPHDRLMRIKLEKYSTPEYFEKTEKQMARGRRLNILISSFIAYAIPTMTTVAFFYFGKWLLSVYQQRGWEGKFEIFWSNLLNWLSGT